MAISDKESRLIDALRFLAVLSVSAAHTTTGDGYASTIMHCFSTCGVALFFFLSGYLFNGTEPFGVFLSKKCRSLLLPWWITGTVVYLYTVLRHGDISLLGWLNWNFGTSTYLWYMSVLFLLYLLFRLIGRSKLLLGVLLFLSAANRFFVLYAYGFFEQYRILYLNIFNWAWLFWLGMMLRKYSSLQALSELCRKYGYLFVPLYIAALIYLTVTKTPLAYWSWQYPAFALLFILTAGAIAPGLSSKWVGFVGRSSFSFYLLHMPIAGLLAFGAGKLTEISAIAGGTAVIAAPFVCVATVSACIWLYVYLAGKIKLSKVMYMLIGLPKRMLANEQQNRIGHHTGV